MKVEVYETFDDYAAGHRTEKKVDKSIRDRKRPKPAKDTARKTKRRKNVRRK
jgi:hypothetical protein